MEKFNVVSEFEAASRIINSIRGRKKRGAKFIPWLGAGASREAGIMTANEICEKILQQMISKRERELKLIKGSLYKFTDEDLGEYVASLDFWKDPDRKYSETLNNGFPGLRG